MLIAEHKLQNLNDTITPNSLILIQKIGEYKGKQLTYENQQNEYLNKLQINAIINNTIASNFLDGLQIDNKTFLDLFEEKSSPNNDFQSEVMRYVKVLNMINSHHNMLEVSPEVIQQFHRNIFSFKSSEAGNWKEVNSYHNVKDIAESIETLCADYNKSIKNEQLLDLLVIGSFLLDFICIDPFDSGTGRIARLLGQLLLFKQDYQIVKYISLDQIMKDHQSRYIYSLQESQNNWKTYNHNLSSWIEFFLWSIYRGYQKLDEQMLPISRKKGSKTLQVKMVIEKLPATFKVGDIAEDCPGISRPTINKVLQEMRNDNLISPLSLGRDALWQKNAS